jgi:hypothetical protein
MTPSTKLSKVTISSRLRPWRNAARNSSRFQSERWCGLEVRQNAYNFSALHLVKFGKTHTISPHFTCEVRQNAYNFFALHPERGDFSWRRRNFSGIYPHNPMQRSELRSEFHNNCFPNNEKYRELARAEHNLDELRSESSSFSIAFLARARRITLACMGKSGASIESSGQLYALLRASQRSAPPL